jgi:hypothetical protein
LRSLATGVENSTKWDKLGLIRGSKKTEDLINFRSIRSLDPVRGALVSEMGGGVNREIKKVKEN